MTTQIENVQPVRSAGKIIARNTLFGIGATFILKALHFVFTILIVRTLGDEHFGQYSIVLAWAGLFSVIGDLGINQYLAREIARDKSAANQFFWDTVTLRFILAAIASVITIAGAIIVTDYSTDIIVGIALFTATYFFSALVAPLQSILTGNERVDVISVMSVVNQLGFMVLAALFLFLGFDFVWLVVAGVVNMPFIAALQFAIIRRNRLGPPHFRVNPKLWGSVIRAGLPFAAVQLSLSFSYQIDTIFLSSYTTNEVVGWYNTAYALTLTLLTISRAFNSALLPTIAREHASNPDSVRPWYFSSVRFIVIIALPIAIGGCILNRNITLLYGEEFLPSALAFSILIWDLPFVMHNAFCGSIATSMKLERRAALIYLSIGTINVVLNRILIPNLSLIGASFATVLTDAFGASLFFIMFRHELGAGLASRRLLRAMIAAIIMGVFVFALRDANIAIAIPIGAVIYGLLILLLRVFTPQEMDRIGTLVSKIAGRRLPGMTGFTGIATLRK